MNFAQVIIDKDSFKIIWAFIPTGKNSKVDVFKFNEIEQVNFVYPQWKRFSFIRNMFLLLTSFTLNTSEFTGSVKITIEIISLSGQAETIELAFSSIKDAEEMEKRLNQAVRGSKVTA